jgi:chaperonin GroES
MSWQVLEEDAAWEEQHDRLLMNLSIVGSNFIKTYYAASVGHNVSELVMAQDLVLDYYAKSVETAARKTHIVPMYRNEIYERCAKGVFRDIRESDWFNASPVVEEAETRQDDRHGITPPGHPDEDTPFRTLEQHRLLDLDGDGYAEPYIVTIEKHSKEVLRIVARWDKEEDIERESNGDIISIKATEYFTKYTFIPSPDGGIYDIGFGVLLSPLNEAVNSGINQLLDSGTMQNSSGGFLGRGAKIRGGVYTMAPWEWKRVDSTGDDLRKSLVPFPERQPSMVMFQLLGLLINYTDRIAGTVDQMVGENPGQNTPAETSRNMTEQGMKVFSMIFKRVWRSMKEEFKKLHKLNAQFLPLRKRYGEGDSYVLCEDYRSNPDLVVPVADPNVTSKASKIAKAQAIRAAAMSVPGYDIPVVERNFLKALEIEGIDKFYPGADKVPPLPNPKGMVEQMKLEGKKLQFEHEKQLFVMDLRAQQRKTMAEIAKLEAEAMATMSGIDTDKAAVRIAAFDAAIGAWKAHNDMLTDRIAAMMGEGNGNKSNGGGIPKLEDSSSNPGASTTSSQLERVDSTSMGDGSV